MSDLTEQTEATRNKLMTFVDNMTLLNKDYDVIRNLIDNMDDALFVKLIEEISNSNASFSDFQRVIGDSDAYKQMLSSSFESQEKLYQNYTKLIEYLVEMSVIETGDRLKYLAMAGSDAAYKLDSDGTATKLTDTTVGEIDRKAVVAQLLNEQNPTNPLQYFYSNQVLRQILSADDSTSNKAIDDLLLSAHEYLVPVDYESISLTNADRLYMQENDVSEDLMRKMKSLAAMSVSELNG